MHKRMCVVAAVLLACVCLVGAKEKKKNTLPDYVLQAQTVMVMIDPDAGIPVNDAQGNRTAQDDVEKALMKWGRLRLVMTMSQADLVIVLRKGNKQAVQPTITGEPTNDRPVIVQGTDSSIRVGVQQGRNPDAAQNGGPLPQKPGLGAESGPGEDTFSVYQGKIDAPQGLLWQYRAKNALKSPEVAAVGEFKKAVDEAVKQQQRQKQPPQPQNSKL